MSNVSTLFTPTTKEEITMRGHKTPSLSPIFLSIFMVAIWMLGASAANVQAATITVTGNGDAVAVDGQCTLREAIKAANANAPLNECPAGNGADTINFDTAGVFAVPQTITLDGTELTISTDLMINGTGATNLTISGNNASRVFFIGGNVTLDGLTITGGNTVGSPGNHGGAIEHVSGTLTITKSIISGNSAEFSGGGIHSQFSVLAIINSTVSGNTASSLGGGGGGGVIVAEGTLTVMASTVSGNYADTGGGIYNNGSTLTVQRSTISGNSSGNGGGIYASAGTTNLTNTTISGNSGNSGLGGGIYYDGGTSTVTNSTIVGNGSTYAGSVYNPGGEVHLDSTIIANGDSPAGCSGIVGEITANYSLIQDAVCGNLSGGNNLIGVLPMVGPLQFNGGPTKTHALLPGSPAINAGSNPLALTVDQRGSKRVIGAATDIGAFENGGTVFTVTKTADTNDGSCDVADCSLREAIGAANSTAGDDTTDFDIPTSDPGYDSVADRYTITLTSVLPDLQSDMFINGLGAKRLTVKRGAAGHFRIFNINSGATVSILGLTISGGLANEGGGIRNTGTLSITGSIIRDNLTENGPQGFCSNVNLNAGDGGGIYNGGYLTIDSSTFIGNKTGIGGPGNDQGTCTWVPGNGGSGGAISNHSGTVIIRNSTFSGNQTGNGGDPAAEGKGGDGGAVYNTGSLSISNTTINANVVGNGGRGSVFNDPDASGSFDLSSSIIANTIGQDDIYGNVFSGDHNLVTNPAGALIGTHNIVGVDPKLGPLADNGGPTPTHALLCGSPAIDKGNNYGDASTDQRGPSFIRKFDDPASANAVDGDGTDIGAFELQAPLVCNTAPVANGDGYTINEDPASPLTGNVLANDTDGENDPLTAAVVTGPSHAQSFTLYADGSFSYTPYANFNGSDSFTYKANDGSHDSNIATATITVNPVNDAPEAVSYPKTQSVQYSDAISLVTTSAFDRETAGGFLLIAYSYSKDGGASVNGLPAGLSQGGFIGDWEVSGTANVPAGTYVITAAITDLGDGPSPPITIFDTFTIVVTRENAVAAPRLSNPVAMQVASAGGTASGTTGQICFDITEIADGSPGNTLLINTATLQINAVGGGSVSSITPSWISFSNTGTSSACFFLSFAGTAPNVFEITLNMGGDYYTGSGNTAFIVFDPSAGFASGGGWIINPNTGYRANYGVNVKYLKNGNTQGSILYIEHRPDGDYKFKSTSLNSSGGFAIVPITGGAEAQIAGKGNYGVNSLFTGNYSFIARVIDKGTPGASDAFGLKLIAPNGPVMNEFTFNPQLLGGGNNQVPKK